MNDEEIKLKCLELAFSLEDDADGTIEIAEKFYNFVAGKKQNKLTFEKTAKERE